MDEVVDAQWDCTLWVECPSCKEDFDILDSDNVPDALEGVGTCESGREVDIYCPSCEHEFTAKTIY